MRLIFGLIANEHAFVVSQDDRIVGSRDQIVRHQRDLTAAVRAVHDVGGDPEPRHVATETFHDLQPFPDGGTEMACADDRITVEQVIGADFNAQKGTHQLSHRPQGIVHPLQKDGMVVNRHAAAQEALADACRFRRYLPSMVEMGLNPDLLRSCQ